MATLIHQYKLDQNAALNTVSDSVGTLHGVGVNVNDGDSQDFHVSYLGASWYLFDGTEDHVDFAAHPLVGLTAWSMSCQIRLFKAGNDATILGSLGDDSPQIVVFGREVRGVDEIDWNVGTDVILDGEVHEITFTYSAADPTTTKVYVDGVLVSTYVDNSATAFNSGLQIAARAAGNLASMLCRNIRFWSGVLTAPQVVANAAANVAELTGLVGATYAKQDFTASSLISFPVNCIHGSQMLIGFSAGCNNAGGGGSAVAYFIRPGESFTTVAGFIDESGTAFSLDGSGPFAALGSDGPSGGGGTFDYNDIAPDIGFNGGNGSTLAGGAGAGLAANGQNAAVGVGGNGGNGIAMLDVLLSGAGSAFTAAGGNGGSTGANGQSPGGGGALTKTGAVGHFTALYLVSATLSSGPPVGGRALLGVGK